MKLDMQWLTLISFDNTWSAFSMRNRSMKDVKIKPSSAAGIIGKYIDTVKRTIKTPEELQKLLKKNKKASGFFDTLSFTNKREYVEWVVTAKQEETKQRRLALAIEKLSSGLKNPSAK